MTNQLIQKWECPHCHAEYYDEAMARKCMEWHAKPSRVSVAEQGSGMKYPDTVWVTFDDGMTFKYTRG